MRVLSLSSSAESHHQSVAGRHAPVFDHALQRLAIEVMCDVKAAQHVQREGAHVYNVLVNVKCPDMLCVKHLLLPQWGLLKIPAIFTTCTPAILCH